MSKSNDIEHRLAETHPYLKDLPSFLNSLNEESDRGAALISAAMLDEALGRCIEKRLVSHEKTKLLVAGFNAPFGTLSSRILGCLGLGIISEAEFEELEVIRKVRNEFAHNVQVSFKTQKISDLCRNLRFCIQDSKGARTRFTTSVVPLIVAALNRATHGAAERLTFRVPDNEKSALKGTLPRNKRKSPSET